MGDDGLPMYIEENPEEAAAEKQKRRQQSRKPPRLRDTPEALAKIEFNRSVGSKFYEYDPKLGASCYTRAWFLDFTEVDINEESIILNSRLNSCLCGSNRLLAEFGVVS